MRALVLSGGGSKGSYQIGVWKALRELNIKIDIVTGTSAGALNAALITQNTYRRAIDTWKKINLNILFGEDAIESNEIVDLYKMYGEKFLKDGGMDTTKIQKIIKNALKTKKFYKSKIDFGLVTFSLTNKKPMELTKSQIKQHLLDDYLMASATCFPAFQKKEINGEEFIDGGYYDNLPINLAIKMGADEIIAVDLSAPGLKRTPNKKVKTITIKPKTKLTNFLNFYEEGAKRNIALGYNDTMKAFNKLEGNRYTFKKGQIEKNNNMYQQTYEHIMSKVLRFKNATKDFYKQLKITSDIPTKLEDKLLLRVMELVAKDFNLDDTKIYTYRSFNRALRKELKKIIKELDTTETRKTKKTEVELYLEMEKGNYKDLRTLGLLNPIELLKAVYLYTICED